MDPNHDEAAADKDERSEETILYEIICCSEWTQMIEDAAPLATSSESALSIFSYINPSTYWRGKSLSPTETISWMRSLAQHWQLATTQDGKILAVLQDTALETRSSRDNFTTALGKINVLKDPYPNYRCVAWSNDSALLAVSFTNGLIIFYNVMAVQLFSIRRDGPLLFEQDLDTPAPDFSIDNYLVGFFFADERISKTTYCSELVTIDRRAQVHCYRQPTADQVELHHESGTLRQYYSKGVTHVIYSEAHSIIIVAGFLNSSELSSRLEASNKYGLTIWRLLLDVPYYRLVHNIDTNEVSRMPREFPMNGKEMWKMAISFTLKNSTKIVDDPIVKICLSPSGTCAAGTHISGAISIWSIPSLKLQAFWPLITQLHYSTENPRFNHRWRHAFNRSRNRTIDAWRFHPFQLTWWNNHILVISRVNGCVTLCSVLHDFPERNLLGDSPELFECPLAVSSRFGSKPFFFALESEYRLKDGGTMKGEKERRDTSFSLHTDPDMSTEIQSESNASDAEDEGSTVKRLFMELMFWATDMERFRPPRRKSKSKKVSWKYSQRLFKLQRITPLELFLRKIEHEEYGDALDLAQVYDLDCDLVFQRQWKKSPVSVHTIRNYLGKIKKRTWVLQECLERVPETEEAARELLAFGLKGTDLPVLVVVSEGRDKGQFVLWTSEDLELTQEEYLQLIEPSNPEVLRLLQYREKYLYYLDVLDTYESILLGTASSTEGEEGGYKAKVYGRLRTKAPHESAMEMARNCDLHGLRILFTHHWSQIAPYCLNVLSSFPETVSPHEYRDFLPELSPDGKHCYFWDEFTKARSRDWCEDILRKVNSKNEGQTMGGAAALIPDVVKKWYESRIKEIEDFSGMTNLALELGRLGLQRNVNKLRHLVQTLEVVEALVYDMGILDVTLHKLENLSNSERLQLIMSKANADTIVQKFKQFAIPFLHQCDEIEPGSKFTLLDQYLSAISTNDLSLTHKIFEYLKTEDGLSLNFNELMQLAKNSIYACEASKQNDNIFNILGCLPDRSYASMPSGSSGRRKSLDEMHSRIDDLELHFNAIQILEKYGIFITVKSIRMLEEFSRAQDAFNQNQSGSGEGDSSMVSANASFMSVLNESIEDNQDDDDADGDKASGDSEDGVGGLFTKMCRLASRIHPPIKVPEWKSLLYDVLELQKKNFPGFPIEKCFEIYVKALLNSSRAEIISLAKDFLQKEDGEQGKPSAQYSTTFAIYLHQIPYAQALELLLDAAYMYFDSSFNYSDSDIALVKVALNIFPNCQDDRVLHLIDLIDVIKILVRDFDMNILPQAVRHTNDKLGLLSRAMENVQHGYRKLSQLLKIGLYLRIENPKPGEPRILGLAEVEPIVLAMAGEAALEAMDCKCAVQICQSAMVKGYSSPSTLWSLFTRLAKWGEGEDDGEEVKLTSLTPQLRQAFVTYALNICPNSEILNVLRVSYIIEMKILRKRLEELSPAENDPSPGNFQTEAEESFVHNLLGKIKVDPLLETTSRWLNPLKTMVDQIKPTLSIISPLSQHSQFNEADDLLSLPDQSSNPAVELCRILNRIWHLERLVLGSAADNPGEPGQKETHTGEETEVTEVESQDGQDQVKPESEAESSHTTEDAEGAENSDSSGDYT